MKFRFVLLAVQLAVVSAGLGQTRDAGSLQETLTATTRAFMEAWTKQDMKAMGETMAPDFVYVGLEGIAPKEGVLQGLAHCALTSYMIRDVQLHRMSATTASLVYKMHQEASCDGHPLPPEMLAVDTFVQRDGRWLLSLTSVTPAPAHDGPR